MRTAPIDRLPKLPFDHGEMVATAVARVRTKSQYSSLPIYLCGERVTLPQLQAVYEAVLGEPINKVSFRRKIEELGMLEPLEGETTMTGAHRPALDRGTLFRARLGDAHHAVDEQPQSHIGRHPPRTGMRMAEQSQRLEFGHDVPDRRRRQAEHSGICERARPDRLTGVEIPLHHRAENVAGAIREFGDGEGGHDHDLGGAAPLLNPAARCSGSTRGDCRP